MWEIYAYHNSDGLFGILNTIAGIMGAGSYAGILAAVAFCGFVAAMVAYVFAPEKLQGWKWLGSVVLIYSVLIVPRVSVGVVDKTGSAPVLKVDNVPLGVAALGGITSTVGDALTTLFETGFQVIPGNGALPAELSYQRNGIMFGSRLVQQTRALTFDDPYLRSDLINFVENCTVYDLEDRSISPADFVKSPDVWVLMKSTNPARFSTISGPTGTTTGPCDAVYASLDARMPTQVNALVTFLGQRMHPTLAAAAAQAAILDQIPQAYIRSQIADAAATASDIVRQNAMINAINDAVESRCVRINDPTCMMMATGRATAVAGQNAAWINGAKIAEQSLPIVRNVAEALMYAIFPIIVLLLLLVSGRTVVMVLSGYLAALVSIQLWPPLFAVLSYMGSIYAQFDLAAAATVGGGMRALSLNTSAAIYGNSISAQAVVSYLVLAIPVLSYSLANRLSNFGVHLTGALMPLQNPSGNVSSAAAAGNATLGNVSMDQRTISPMTSSPFVSRVQDVFGNWHTHDGAGRTAVSFLRNEGVASVQVSSRVTASDVESANMAATAARGDAVSAATAKSAVLTEIFNRAHSNATRSQQGNSESYSTSESTSKAAEEFGAETQRIANQLGTTQGQVASTILRATAMPGLSGINAGGGVSKTYSSGLSAADQKIIENSTSETFKSAKAYADAVTQDRTFLSALSTESHTGRSLASSLVSTTATAETAERKYSEAVTRAQEFRKAHELGIEARYDLTSDPIHVERLIATQEAIRRYGDNPQAIAAHLSSSLGNLNVTPTRFENGSRVPTSFNEVRRIHSEQAAAPDLSSISAVKAVNDRAVNGLGSGSAATGASGEYLESPTQRSNVTSSSEFRSQVDQRRVFIDAAKEKTQRFEADKSIRTGPNGREVGSDRSLVDDTVRGAGNDVTSGVRNMIDAAGSHIEEQKRRLDSQIGEARNIINSQKPLPFDGSRKD